MLTHAIALCTLAAKDDGGWRLTRVVVIAIITAAVVVVVVATACGTLRQASYMIALVFHRDSWVTASGTDLNVSGTLKTSRKTGKTLQCACHAKAKQAAEKGKGDKGYWRTVVAVVHIVVNNRRLAVAPPVVHHVVIVIDCATPPQTLTDGTTQQPEQTMQGLPRVLCPLAYKRVRSSRLRSRGWAVGCSRVQPLAAANIDRLSCPKPPTVAAAASIVDVVVDDRRLASASVVVPCRCVCRCSVLWSPVVAPRST